MESRDLSTPKILHKRYQFFCIGLSNRRQLLHSFNKRLFLYLGHLNPFVQIKKTGRLPYRLIFRRPGYLDEIHGLSVPPSRVV